MGAGRLRSPAQRDRTRAEPLTFVRGLGLWDADSGRCRFDDGSGIFIVSADMLAKWALPDGCDGLLLTRLHDDHRSAQLRRVGRYECRRRRQYVTCGKLRSARSASCTGQASQPEAKPEPSRLRAAPSKMSPPHCGSALDARLRLDRAVVRPAVCGRSWVIAIHRQQLHRVAHRAAGANVFTSNQSAHCSC